MVWSRGKSLFGDRYVIESKLGEGGVGITYLAKNRRGELRVIKTLREEILNAPAWQPHQGKLKQDFKDEALRLSFCRHLHIVEIENLFDDGSFPCMVMEYIPGEDLGKIIITKGALSETEALLYIRQIGDALMVVHERGLLHRDLKPSNIMMRQGKQEAVLIDFGIARQFIPGSVQQHTQSLTPGFAPPEQYVPDGEKGEYIDVYALAATLYSLVTGQLPMPVTARLQNIPLTPPQDLNSGNNISNRVNEAIMKGMALNYQFRPQSVEEWLDILGAGTIPPTQSSQKSVNVSPPQQPVNNPVSQPQPQSPPPTEPITGLPLKTFSFKTVAVNHRGKIINRRNLQAKYFVEDLGDGVTLEMVQIPGGTFVMGCSESEASRVGWQHREMEGPQHQVTVEPFFMGKYVITQEQYQVLTGKNPSFSKNETTNWLFGKKNKNKNRPVEEVSWYDAVEFCFKLSKATGKEYRLPSEAEWEYACRAGTTTPFYFGKDVTTDLVNCNPSYSYASAPKVEFREQTTDVGIFPPNAFGLYDMHGNVSEWCADPWHDNYEGAPTDGRVWLENGNEDYSPRRGGSFLQYALWCRSAHRSFQDKVGRDFISPFTGFRVVCGFGRT